MMRSARKRFDARSLILIVHCMIGTLLLAACHQDMYDQPRGKPYRASRFFRDSMAMRPLVPGTVSRESPRTLGVLYTGKIGKEYAAAFPFPITRPVLARGQDRFDIFCSPCHGALGDGRGMIVQRGFPQPPSYHEERLRNAHPGYFFDVITNGFGRMYSYAERIPVRDRWAIAAYIKVLQLSENAQIKDLPADRQRELMQQP
jgi:mono/diheme cytochrome c family protein